MEMHTSPFKLLRTSFFRISLHLVAVVGRLHRIRDEVGVIDTI